MSDVGKIQIQHFDRHQVPERWSVLAQAALLLLGTFVAGLVYGYLFWCTDSLWVPWIAHFLNNTVLNLILVRDSSGEVQPAVLMSVVVVVALALITLAMVPIVKRLKLPHLQPWNT